MAQRLEWILRWRINGTANSWVWGYLIDCELRKKFSAWFQFFFSGLEKNWDEELWGCRFHFDFLSWEQCWQGPWRSTWDGCELPCAVPITSVQPWHGGDQLSAHEWQILSLPDPDNFSEFWILCRTGAIFMVIAKIDDEPLDHLCKWPPPDNVDSSLSTRTHFLFHLCLLTDGGMRREPGLYWVQNSRCHCLQRLCTWTNAPHSFETSSKTNTSSLLAEKCLLLKAECFTGLCVLSCKCHQEHC